MWRLKPPSQALIKWYKEEMLNGLKERILSSEELPDGVKDILVSSVSGIETVNLKKLLVADPENSFILNNWLWRRISNLYSGLNPKDKADKLKGLKGIILKVFDYEYEISQKKRRSYYMTEQMGAFTCPYCNRHYTITTIADTKEASKGKMPAGSRITRPHLDHWFDKADYPLLSLNLYNLIPCCPVCNSSIKGSAKFSLSTHIHPYLYEKEEPPFVFKRIPNPERKGKMHYIVAIDSSECDKKEKKMIEDLSLQEVYAYHGMLEAKDIMDWSIENTPAYIKGLFRGVLAKYKCSHEDAFRMFFGTEYLPAKNLDRPLSKMKRDIMKQLGLLNDKGEFEK